MPTLPGYRGMGPVRVGNQAVEQFQHDVYGSVVLACDAAVLRPAPGAPRRPGAVRAAGAARRARRRDLRPARRRPVGIPRHARSVHTYSAVMCWAACDRLARIAARLGARRSRRATGRRAPTRMREAILDGAWNEERQAFTLELRRRDLDASALLLPELACCRATDPRFLAHRRGDRAATARAATCCSATHADDFGMPETAFNICTFWYIDALAALGRARRGARAVRALLARRNPLGLLSEDIDPTTGELWGNFPQTYAWSASSARAAPQSRRWEDVRMSRLVVVSNRVAVPQARRRAGGLAVGCWPRCRRAAACGSAGAARPPRRASGEPSIVRKRRHHLAHDRPDQAEYDDYYIGFGNGTLWPLFHYFRRRLPLQRRAATRRTSASTARSRDSSRRCSSRTTSSGCTTTT